MYLAFNLKNLIFRIFERKAGSCILDKKVYFKYVFVQRREVYKEREERKRTAAMQI